MREFLFRGKRVDNGKWVEGELLHDMKSRPWIYWTTPKELPVFFSRNAIVNPETIGQYTGLTDKNGKKVFEGDILQGYQYPYLSEGHSNYYAEVVYFENCPAFGLCTFKNPNLDIVHGISSGNTEFIEDWESEDWEVIGNIYDNPELLEDKE